MTSYNVKSEKSLIQLFMTLEPVKELEGVYTAEIPGPRFLVPIKKLFLGISGLPGWVGKQFFGDYALNMLTKKGELYAGPKMLIKKLLHQIDSKEGLVATYDSDAPFIWQHCTDEFRHIDDNTILGMSHFDLPGFRGKPTMFLLHKTPYKEGLK